MVARTAADEHATTEITGLAEQAAEAAQALRETLQQATLAAEALALPGPDNPGSPPVSLAPAHPMIWETFSWWKKSIRIACFASIRSFPGSSHEPRGHPRRGAEEISVP